MVNDNVRMVIVKQHIPQESLTKANSRLVSIWTIVGISAPSAAGALLGILTHEQVLMVIVGLLVCALFAIRGLPADPSNCPPSTIGIVAAFREGISILAKNKPLLQLCLMVLFMNVAQGVIDANLIFILKDRYLSSDVEIGVVSSMAGAGAFLGSLLAPKARTILGIGKLFRTSFIWNVLFCFPSIFFPHPITFGMTLLGTSVFGMMQSICVWTFRQETTGAQYIGRVSGLTSALFKLGLPISLFISGHFISGTASAMVFVVAAALNFALFLVFPYSRVAKAV